MVVFRLFQHQNILIDRYSFRGGTILKILTRMKIVVTKISLKMEIELKKTRKR